MKTFLACAVVLAAVLTSCSKSDDDPKTDLKYVIHVDAPIITNISYKAADGTTTTVTDQGGPDWEKTIHVKKPFAATMTVSFQSVSPTSAQYYLAIFKDGSAEPSGYTPGVVPPNAINTGTVTFNLN